MSLPRPLDVASSWIASASRLGSGMIVGKLGPRPEKPVELFEFESCPFCRRVREALTMLDLDAVIRPCPKGGVRFRPIVLAEGGKRSFPWLRDPNTGASLYESSDIVAYLYKTYGASSPPAFLTGALSTPLSGAISTVSRGGRGARVRPSREPETLLELWSFEASPYCRIAREALTELELPYLLHNVGKKSPKRPAFRELSGKMMVPFLLDPNTGEKLFESAEVVRYLERTYGA